MKKGKEIDTEETEVGHKEVLKERKSYRRRGGNF
jgi:hypothetical protein